MKCGNVYEKDQLLFTAAENELQKRVTYLKCSFQSIHTSKQLFVQVNDLYLKENEG